MFAHAPDASKIAFVALVSSSARWEITLIDCQVYTDHLARFGAEVAAHATSSRRCERARPADAARAVAVRAGVTHGFSLLLFARVLRAPWHGCG